MSVTQLTERAVYLLLIVLCLAALLLAVISPAAFMDAGAVYQGF
jgi:hypothetical protein